MLREFRRWADERFGGDIAWFNQYCGTSYGSFAEVDPPRDTTQFGAGGQIGAYWQLWAEFREQVVRQVLLDQARWINEQGIPPERIYSHQMSTLASNPNYGKYGTSYRSADIRPFGQLGLTNYDTPPCSGTSVNSASDPALLVQFQTLAADWQSGEYNAMRNYAWPTPGSYAFAFPAQPPGCNFGPDYAYNLNALERSYNYGLHVNSPWYWGKGNWVLPSVVFVVYDVSEPTTLQAYRDFAAEVRGLPYPSMQWSFNPDGDFEGFVAAGTVAAGTFSSSGGALHLVPNGVDAYLVAPLPLAYPAASTNAVRVRARLPNVGTCAGQIYWITDTDATWAGSKIVGFDMPGTGAYATYEVPVGQSAA